MGVRLIATDVDGTLITSAGTISRRTLAAFEAAHAAGVLILPISGRQPFSIEDVVGGTVLHGPVVGATHHHIRHVHQLALAAQRLAQPGVGLRRATPGKDHIVPDGDKQRPLGRGFKRNIERQ